MTGGGYERETGDFIAVEINDPPGTSAAVTLTVDNTGINEGQRLPSSPSPAPAATQPRRSPSPSGWTTAHGFLRGNHWDPAPGIPTEVVFAANETSKTLTLTAPYDERDVAAGAFSVTVLPGYRIPPGEHGAVHQGRGYRGRQRRAPGAELPVGLDRLRRLRLGNWGRVTSSAAAPARTAPPRARGITQTAAPSTSTARWRPTGRSTSRCPAGARTRAGPPGSPSGWSTTGAGCRPDTRTGPWTRSPGSTTRTSPSHLRRRPAERGSPHRGAGQQPGHRLELLRPDSADDRLQPPARSWTSGVEAQYWALERFSAHVSIPSASNAGVSLRINILDPQPHPVPEGDQVQFPVQRIGRLRPGTGDRAGPHLGTQPAAARRGQPLRTVPHPDLPGACADQHVHPTAGTSTRPRRSR